jgi:hypothetical protein
MAKLLFSILLLILPVLCISLSSAQLTITTPNAKYSLGDELKVSLNANEPSGTEGIISLILSCDSYEAPFFATSVKLNANEPRSFTIEPLKLTTGGICTIKAELKKVNEMIDDSETSDFEISSDINLTIQINKKYFLPGEKLEILGSAQKANGLPFTGIGIINFDGVEHNVNTKGKFAFGITLDQGIQSGEHNILVLMNDSYGNLGSFQDNISVQVVPTSIDINLNEETFIPGDILSAKIGLYDQANDEINESISVTLYNPWGVDVQTEIIKEGDFNFEFSKDVMPGNWWVYAFSKGIKERKFFYVEEYEKIDADIINDTLKIKNEGNVAYQRPIQILFTSENNTETQVINLDIAVGKTDSFKLNAPDGDYNITIRGNRLEESFNAILTGKAISVKSPGIGGNLREILVAAFILAILALSFLARYKIKNKGINVKLRGRE